MGGWSRSCGRSCSRNVLNPAGLAPSPSHGAELGLQQPQGTMDWESEPCGTAPGRPGLRAGTGHRGQKEARLPSLGSMPGQRLPCPARNTPGMLNSSAGTAPSPRSPGATALECFALVRELQVSPRGQAGLPWQQKGARRWRCPSRAPLQFAHRACLQRLCLFPPQPWNNSGTQLVFVKEG